MRTEWFFSYEYNDSEGHRYEFVCTPVTDNKKLEFIVKSPDSLFDEVSGCVFVQENIDPLHIEILQEICEKRNIPHMDSTDEELHNKLKKIMEADVMASEWIKEALVESTESNMEETQTPIAEKTVEETPTKKKESTFAPGRE